MKLDNISYKIIKNPTTIPLCLIRRMERDEDVHGCSYLLAVRGEYNGEPARTERVVSPAKIGNEQYVEREVEEAIEHTERWCRENYEDLLLYRQKAIEEGE